MIVVVRIAPADRWCNWRRSPSAWKTAGMEIKIDASSMRNPGKSAGIECEGRIWKVLPESVRQIYEKMNITGDENSMWACEHVLEMD